MRTSPAADGVLYDASRVSGHEVLLAHIWSGGRYAVAPLHILADQPGACDVAAGMAAVAASATGRRGKALAKRGVRHATLEYGAAVCQSVLAVMPYKSFAVYVPSPPWKPFGADDVARKAFGERYVWSQTDHESRWRLADDLMLERGDLVRILVTNCDEGPRPERHTYRAPGK